MRSRLATLPALVVLTLLVAMCSVTSPTPARASCSGHPPRSPAAFIGVVVQTRSKGRIATVRTAAGATVEVVGTPATEESEGTSVDRTFEVGARYQFHPVNNASPYEDNDCTATRLLSRAPSPAASTAAPTPAERHTGTPTVAPGFSARTLLLIAVVIGAIETAGLLLRRRRLRARAARVPA